MTDHAQRNDHTIYGFTKFCLSVMINSHVSNKPIDIECMQSVIKGFSPSKIAIILVIWNPCDHEILS